jgi:hypothetical protein
MPILAFSPRWLLFGGWFCSHLLLGTVWSAELGQAKVSAILRDVQKTEGSKTEPAAVGDVIAGGGKITTQGQSLAELKFPDGSVIRIGNNSTFSFDPNDRTVRLDRGTALVSTPPKAEGINIVSSGVSGTVGGDPAGKTFLVTAYPAESGGAKGAPTGGFGLMVLQGSSATTVSAPSGSVNIAPGQFALVGGKMDGAPKVLTVDVGQVFRSSPLVNSFPEPLPTKGAILSTAIQQQGSQSSGGLRSTGTTGVALTSGGDLLTGGSKPPKSGGYTFEIASNTPGTGRQEKQATATEKNALDIATAAGGPTGGGGIVGAVTGSTGSGGGGGGGVNVPSIPSTPANTGQSGITANPNNPNNQNNQNNLPATVVNAQVQSKTYDGLVSAMIQNALLSGIQSGDSVSLQNDTTGIFANKNVGTWSVSTTMGLVGTDASRYLLTQPSLTGIITAKSLTISVATPSTVTSKVYNGTRDAAVTAGALDGVVAGEALGATTVVGTFADKNIGTKNVAAVYTLVNGSNGELAGNYSLADEMLTGTITAKDLSVFSAAVTTKVYDGNDTAVVTGAVLVGNSTTDIDGKFIGTETVTLNGGTAGTFASKNVGAGQGVTTTMTLGGSDAGNYTLNTQPTLSGTITAKALTISVATPSTVASKVYNGTQDAAVTVGTLDGLVGTEVLGATTVVGTFADKNIGTKNVAAVYTLVNGSNGELASNYSLAAETLSGTITAKDLSVFSAAVTTKVYDGNDTAVVTGAVLVGNSTTDGDGKFIGTETVTLNGGTAGTFASKNVGVGQGVVTTMTLGGSDAGNYTLLNQPTLTGTITAKDLSVFSATVTTKVYDGNDTAVVTGAVLLGSSTSGSDGQFVGTEAVILNGGSGGTFASKNVGAGQGVTTTMTLGGSDAGNYTLLNQPTLTGTITAKDLSVFSAAVTTKVYDGNDTAVVTGAVLVGNSTTDIDGKFIGTETVTLNGGTAGTFASKNVGAGQGVTTTMTLGGSDAGNYTLNTQPTLSGTITAKALTISVVTPSTVASKVYNGTRNAAVTVGALDGEVAGESLGATTVVGTFADKNIGTKNVAAVYTLVNGSNGELASNYTLAGETLTGTITAKDLSVFSAAVTTKAYDGNDAAVVTGAVLVGNSTSDNDGKFIGAETVTLNGGTAGTFASKNVGAGQGVTTTMTLGGADAGNYTLNTQPTLNGTITAKALSISVATPSTVASKVYNGTRDAAVTVGALDGEVAGETLGATTVVGTFADKNIGTKNVAAVYTLVNGSNGELASNYTLAGETLTGTITAKDLSVFSAAVTTKVYDGNDTAVVTGAVLMGNSATDIDGKFIGTETVTLNGGTAGTFASKNVGAGQGVTTTMTLGGSDAGNYTLNTQPTLSGTITAKALTISVATPSTVASKVYNGTRDAAVTVGALDGEVAGETLGATTVVGTFADKNIGTKNVAAVYTLVNGSNGELASNYTLAGETLTGTITAKDLSVFSAAVTTKAYDGSDAAVVTGAVLVGSSTSDSDGKFIGTETVTLNGGTAGTFASKNVGAGQGVTTTMTLGGSDAGNYTLNTQPTLSGTITAKALTISVATPSTVASKVYSGTRDAAVTVGTLDGLVGTEVLGATTVVGTFADKNIGTKNVAAVYTLVNGSNGELASNYSLASETLTGTITAKDLSVFSAAVTTKVYDGNDTAVVTGAVLVGNSTTDIDGKFIGTETVTLNGATVGTFASKNVGAGQGVTTTMTLGGSDAGNYTLNTQPTLSGTITAKALTMTGSSAPSKVYDGNRLASVTLGTLSGEVAGETLGASTVLGTFNSKDVLSANTVTAVYTLVDGANGELASNYSLANDSLASTITAKSLSISAPSIASKVYNGNATAGSLTLGTLSGFVGSETVTASGAAADYSSANVGTYSGVAVSYTLSNGSNGGLASNYSLAAGSATGVITAKDVTIASGSVSGKVYDGNTGAVLTAGSLSGLVLGESLGTTTAAGTFASKDVGTRNVAASYTLTDGANLASNYNLLNPTEALSAAITAKGLSVTAPSISSKKYDGTTAAGVVTVGTLSGFVGTETVTAAGSAANYSSANVGSYSSAVNYTLSDGSNGGLASNYSLAAGSATGAISAKDLVVNAAGITVGKIYDGGTSINPATQVAIGLGALTGSSTGANDGNYIGTEAVTLAVDAAGVFERNLPGTMIPISTTVKLASGNAVNNNYTLRGQPTGLTGEITGIANLNQNGVGISVSSADYIHIRNTTASRMQDGLSISSATGSVLLENSSFDGWMQRSTPNQTISDGGATTFTFTESASIAVNSPVLRVKMEANDPANVDMNKQFMLLGDYQVLLRRDPNGAPGSGDEVATTLFSFPGSANDPNGFGSMAPSADLVIRDSATTQVKDLPWDTKEYSSLNGSGAAVDSGNYASVQGEFKGDNAASGLDIATSSGGAAGKWDVMVSDPILGGEGKVTDVRLKYNNNTKALIQGPSGVRLVNVIFEGMDEVEVGAGLNDKVLMSGTLVSDPNIGKMVVKAGQTLEAQFASDATMKEVRTSAGNAEILAGVVKDVSSPTGYSFISGPNRVLEMQSATIAGQLSLASHTIVFNNANITSGGVIDARTRDGMVNRTYGSVVPGTVSFMGANGNTFLNTANSASMSIANSGNIVSALSGGQMRENGAGGATVMNVGRVR